MPTPQTEEPDKNRRQFASVNDEEVDPTRNVLDLVAAATLRQDDLRDAERRYNDLRAKHQTEISQLRDDHSKAMNDKESSRLDSIRQVDREESNQKAIAAQQAITTLANSTTVLKDTLQAQVQNTAVLVENKQAAFQQEVNKRLSNLELIGSEGKGKSGVREPVLDELAKAVQKLADKSSVETGKQAVADPQMVTFMAETKAMREANFERQGGSRGIKDMGGWIVGGIAFFISIMVFLFLLIDKIK